MQKRLVLINVGVVIIGLIAAALLAMPLVRNLYLEEFHRGGIDCWNHTYLYHELATVVFSRGEEA